MSEQELTSGPYMKWLRDARAAVGERVWEHLMDLPAPYADTLLRSMGVIPFDDSHHFAQWAASYLDPRSGANVVTETVRDGSPEGSPGHKPVHRAPPIDKIGR